MSAPRFSGVETTTLKNTDTAEDIRLHAAGFNVEALTLAIV